MLKPAPAFARGRGSRDPGFSSTDVFEPEPVWICDSEKARIGLKPDVPASLQAYSYANLTVYFKTFFYIKKSFFYLRALIITDTSIQ